MNIVKSLFSAVVNFFKDVRDNMAIYETAERNGLQVNMIIRDSGSFQTYANVSPAKQRWSYRKHNDLVGNEIIPVSTSLTTGKSNQWITV